MRDTIVLRMNEITLKKGNRAMFERVLVANVAARLKPIGTFKVRRDQGSVIAVHDGPLSPEQIALAKDGLTRVFGLARILFGARIEKDAEKIAAAAIALTANKQGTFKVFARRADKKFPITSNELAPMLGERILAANPALAVDVHAPQIRVTVDITHEYAFVAADECQSAGGLPAGVTGSVVTLLSGGIDSPVAAWKLMRRGCKAVFVHFHSRPYVGRASEDKARRLATILSDWQGESVFWTVAIGDAQREIMLKAGEPFRVLLYRRLMLRIAEKIAQKEKALALVTGDSVGQVASQTLENISAVSAATRMPIYRPLIGDDKEDIVRVARTIGTYAVSIEAHDDCCSLFMPASPATRSTIAQLDAEEGKYDMDTLASTSLAAAVRETIGT